MGVRRDTPNRLTLYRTCATCGRGIVTTASFPFMRLVQADGHAKISYYCSERCKAASYKHLFDGRAGDRKRKRDAARSAEKNRRYYEAHREQEKARQKARYWADPEARRADLRYSKRHESARLQGCNRSCGRKFSNPVGQSSTEDIQRKWCIPCDICKRESRSKPTGCTYALHCAPPYTNRVRTAAGLCRPMGRYRPEGGLHRGRAPFLAECPQYTCRHKRQDGQGVHQVADADVVQQTPHGQQRVQNVGQWYSFAPCPICYAGHRECFEKWNRREDKP